MSKTIDLGLDLPASEDQIVSIMKLFASGGDEDGIANYRHIIGEGRARELGLTLEELQRMADELSPEEFDTNLRERARSNAPSLPQFVKDLDEAEVEWGIVCSVGEDLYQGHEETARIVAEYPNKFIGAAPADPHQGMKAVRQLERAVKELGLACMILSPFNSGLRLNDKKHYPLYAKAVELDIPVIPYCSMNYRTDTPMDVGRPLYLDEVAMDFPEMTIIAGFGGGGGWPWVPEMVGVARRHQNVYVNMSAHRPKHLATPGSGWEMLMQFGNTVLQDRIVFASGWSTYFSYSKDVMKNVIQEMRSLPIKEEVKEKWLYKNAARLFRRD